MRVIAGSAKSLRLKTVPGLGTRPTTDRIKETLFNMLQPYLADAVFCDLFSGSGAIGIEALSRGAKKAVFVESNRKAFACIQDNLAFTGLDKQAEILCMDVFSALSAMEGRYCFDVVFMDPPYDQLLEKQVLERLSHSNLIDENTMIIVEASNETAFDYAKEFGFVITKRKEYKTNVHIFLQREH